MRFSPDTPHSASSRRVPRALHAVALASALLSAPGHERPAAPYSPSHATEADPASPTPAGAIDLTSVTEPIVLQPGRWYVRRAGTTEVAVQIVFDRQTIALLLQGIYGRSHVRLTREAERSVRLSLADPDTLPLLTAHRDGIRLSCQLVLGQRLRGTLPWPGVDHALRTLPWEDAATVSVQGTVANPFFRLPCAGSVTLRADRPQAAATLPKSGISPRQSGKSG